jgi:hypothetical protein
MSQWTGTADTALRASCRLRRLPARLRGAALRGGVHRGSQAGDTITLSLTQQPPSVHSGCSTHADLQFSLQCLQRCS